MGPISFVIGKFIVSTSLMLLYRPWIQSDGGNQDGDGQEQVNIRPTSVNEWSYNSQLFFWGIIGGCATYLASILVHIGMATVSVGEAGFLTGMYVVFVPVVEYITPGFGTHLTWKSWLAVVLCAIGLYFISGCADQEQCLGDAMGYGEFLIILSMFCWVASIIIGDVAAKNLDVISFTLVDFSTCLVLSIITAALYEPECFIYPFTPFTKNWLVILIVGVGEAAAFPLSTLGQTHVEPTRASLLMSLDSFFCVIGGYLFLHEVMTWWEGFGSLVVFSAVVVSTTSNSDADVVGYEPLGSMNFQGGEDIVEDRVANENVALLESNSGSKRIGVYYQN